MSPLIPMVVEADGRYERSFDIYSRLLRERIGVDAVQRLAALLARLDEPRLAQRGQVLRHRLPGYRQLRRELRRRRLLPRERLDDVAPGRVTERVEDVAQA